MQELENAEKRVSAVEQELQPIIDYSGSVNITNDEQLAEAGEYLKKIQERKRELEDERVSFVRPLNDVVSKINAKFKEPKERLERAANALKQGISKYHAFLEKQRREQQRKLDEQAARERAKLEKRAEQVKTPEKAEEYRERAASVVAPVVQTEAPKVSGVSLRSVWKAEVTDLDALIKAAAAGDTLARACLIADQKVLNSNAKSLKENFKVPGVRVWEDKTVAA